ncbi:MAG: cytochrome c oxidase subunit II [Candidatus Latescibacteria bacterium]|nr:cytochrome c oxidase subunit II [Candidatus Latescibacterota bacterium]NIM22156.1 cytochrome c oxidase subunit II [Candidatus Latescibacterota bacterium]NIM64706.1 cytochrome c oxidase subunit II [Candidatus Latescibacterota bacterium]NIO01216.1 cytochrome c oxidase subunit II [Candidatus Latescibacterota bacterium]NIO27601.1 cytochrome c oxidase subunit II [Candidatus Latescibacterota bacterium]
MFESLSNIAESVNTAFFFILVISIAMLVLITFLMVFFVIKYSRKRHPTSKSIEGNKLLEVVWTVVPTLLVLGMFYFGWVGYKFMKDVPEDAMVVNATGRMWSWLFEYENGVQSDTLWVPLGRSVHVKLESQDVLHSFYVPAFKIKQDLVPGMTNYVWFTAKEPGEYELFCAEYCGQRHSYMLSKVVVLPEDEFNAWLEKEAKFVSEREPSPDADERELTEASLIRRGERLSKIKGCSACHSTDGSRMVGPTFKGIFGRSTVVVANGEEREVVVDEDYLRKATLNPEAEIVKGFQALMPPQRSLLDDEELDAIIEYLKQLK